MDMSKLPRLSQTPATPPAENPASPAAPQSAAPTARPAEPPMGVMEAWLSIGVGLFLWYWQPRMLQWISSRLFHTAFSEFELEAADGSRTVIPYPKVPEFWMDLGPALFGLVLILDGIILAFAPRRPLVLFSFVLTVLTTAYNLIYLVVSYNKYGAAPLSFLATLFGGFVAYSQWQILKASKPTHQSVV